MKTMNDLTEQQVQEVYDAMLVIHAAMHSIDERISYEFASRFQMDHADASVGDMVSALFQEFDPTK